MSSAEESPFVFTSTIPVEGVLPTPVSAPRSSFPSTPLTPMRRMFQPLVHSNIGGTSGDMVTGIPSIPTIPSSFPYTTQSGPVGSSAFVQGFPWNGGHIPPSSPYVGPSPSYVGVQFGSNTSYGQSFQTPILVPYTSSLFSLFSGGIPAPVFQTPASMGMARTTYTAPPTQNPVAYGWNPFQSNLPTSQSVSGGNPTFTYGHSGARPSNPQACTSSAPITPKLPFLATLNLPDLSKLMNNPVRHDPLWPPVPTKLPSDIPKLKVRLVNILGLMPPPSIYGVLPTH